MAKTQNSKRKLTSLELSRDARSRLSRLKKKLGWTKTRSIEQGLVLLEKANEGVSLE